MLVSHRLTVKHLSSMHNRSLWVHLNSLGEPNKLRELGLVSLDSLVCGSKCPLPSDIYQYHLPSL